MFFSLQTAGGIVRILNSKFVNDGYLSLRYQTYFQRKLKAWFRN